MRTASGEAAWAGAGTATAAGAGAERWSGTRGAWSGPGGVGGPAWACGEGDRCRPAARVSPRASWPASRSGRQEQLRRERPGVEGRRHEGCRHGERRRARTRRRWGRRRRGRRQGSPRGGRARPWLVRCRRRSRRSGVFVAASWRRRPARACRRGATRPGRWPSGASCSPPAGGSGGLCGVNQPPPPLPPEVPLSADVVVGASMLCLASNIFRSVCALPRSEDACFPPQTACFPVPLRPVAPWRPH